MGYRFRSKQFPSTQVSVWFPKATRTRLPKFGFVPSDIDGLALWLDAADTSTIIESGGGVSQWNDKSGNGYNVAQATAAQQPTTNLNVINGKNVLRFDGGDVLSGPMAVNVGAATVFVVGRETTEVNFAGLFVLAPSSGSDQTTSNSLVTQTGATGVSFAVERNAASALIATSGASPLGVYVGRYASGGLIEAFSNTVTGGTATASGTFGNSTTALVGGRYQSGSISALFRLNGDIAEILVFSKTFINNEMNAVGSYLSQKWGLSWANK